MSQLAFAKVGFVITVLLTADLSVALARDLHHGSRRRIGRVIRPLGSTIAPVPFLHFSWRDTFDYYGNRRIVPKARGPISQVEIISSLKKRGFRDIAAPRHRGTTYIVEVTGPLNERVRLVINGKTGGIDGVRVIGFGKR